MAIVDTSRIRKLGGTPQGRLAELLLEHARFDLAYVDGLHLGVDILVDAVFLWVAGYLVPTNHVWAVGGDVLLRTGPAIDAFLSLIAGRHGMIFSNETLRKTA